MKDRLSITWSNSHQQLLNEILAEALNTDRLIITNTGEFSFCDSFFEQKSTKDFLNKIPRDMLNDMVKAWIKSKRPAITPCQ